MKCAFKCIAKNIAAENVKHQILSNDQFITDTFCNDKLSSKLFNSKGELTLNIDDSASKKRFMELMHHVHQEMMLTSSQPVNGSNGGMLSQVSTDKRSSDDRKRKVTSPAKKRRIRKK